MGVVRYPVQCAGCQAAIMLRLGVGHERRQPFFLVCPRCNAITRGAQMLTEDMKTSLELEDGALLDSYDDCVVAVSINPELPSVPGTGSFEDPDGSPFLMHTRLLGPERASNYSARIRAMATFADKPFKDLARLATYYVHSDWERFEEAGRRLYGATGGIGQLALRDALIGRAFHDALAPFWTADETKPYGVLRDEWDAILGTDRTNFERVVSFARAEAVDAGFLRLLDDLFKLALRYFEMRHALLPGLLLDWYPPSARARIPQLRLFRDDFEPLRDLYLQTFESCHKVVRYVLGVANADACTDPDRFPATWPGALVAGEQQPPPRPASLGRFDRLPNIAKGQWLAVLPGWRDVWIYSLDRQLRNDMGHGSIRHELHSGLLVRDDAPPLHYIEFVETAHRIVHALLGCIHVMITLRRLSRP